MFACPEHTGAKSVHVIVRSGNDKYSKKCFFQTASGKDFSSIIKGKRFKRGRNLPHTLFLISSLWMRLCEVVHNDWSHGGHLDSWGKAKGILDSLNSCPDGTEPWATDTLIVLNDFYPSSFLIFHHLFPVFSLLFILITYLRIPEAEMRLVRDTGKVRGPTLPSLSLFLTWWGVWINKGATSRMFGISILPFLLPLLL